MTLAAQQAAPATTPSAPPGFEIPKDMTTYYVALYVKGPKHMATGSPEHTALTRRHLEYIRRMIEEHKYTIAGPLLDGGDTQGLAIISAPNADEAKRARGGGSGDRRRPYDFTTPPSTRYAHRLRRSRHGRGGHRRGLEARARVAGRTHHIAPRASGLIRPRWHRDRDDSGTARPNADLLSDYDDSSDSLRGHSELRPPRSDLSFLCELPREAPASRGPSPKNPDSLR